MPRSSFLVVSPKDEEATAPRLKPGLSILVTGSDSWGALSVDHLASVFGVPVANYAEGGSLTDQWLPGGKFFEVLRGAVVAASDVALVYLSMGGLDAITAPGLPGRTQAEVAVQLAEIVNLIHSIKHLDVVHASYNAPFTITPADPSLLVYPARYEFVDLSDLVVSYYESDPLHLIPESYLLRVQALSVRSVLAQRYLKAA